MADEDESTLSSLRIFDEQAAIDFLEAKRWPEGVTCPRCDSDPTKKISTSNWHQCNACRTQFIVHTGSIFERSKIHFRKWLYATHLIQTAQMASAACNYLESWVSPNFQLYFF